MGRPGRRLRSGLHSLLHLLLGRLVILFGYFLIFLLLLLGYFLPLFVLLRVELLLLLLVFLVLLCVARVRRRGALGRGKLTNVARRGAGASGVSACGARCVSAAIRGPRIGAARLSRRYRVIEVSRPGCCRDRGSALVPRGTELGIATGRLLMLRLSRDRGNMSLTRRSLLLRGGTRVDAAFAAVVADVIHLSHVDGGVVDIVNFCDIHVHDGAVVKEVPTVPAATLETKAEVAEAVVRSEE